MRTNKLFRIITYPFHWFMSILNKITRKARTLPEKIIPSNSDDTPLTETLAKAVQNPSELLWHIDDLRKHLLWVVIVLAIATAFSFTFTPQIIDYLAKPIGGIQALRAIDVTEPISVYMRVALLSGFAVSLPIIAFVIWRFIAPGLKKKELIFSFFAIPVTSLFFFGGMAFAYYFMLPTAVPFLVNFMGIQTQIRPSSYIQFVTNILFWIGIFFEFPLVIYIFAAIGLLRWKLLADQWKIAVVVIAIIAAAITPTVDPVNMALVMGPMVLLYFLSIGLAFLAQRGREKSSKNTGTL